MSDSPATDPIHRVSDLATASDFELKHTPTISVEPADSGYMVTVETGKAVPHPSTPDHWINWLDLRVNDSTVARFDLSCVVAPRVTCFVSVEKGATLKLISSCNIHGLWETDLVI